MASNVMRGSLPQVRWTPVLAGVAVALAAHVCLGLFGAAMGYAAEAHNSRPLGLAAGLWSLMSAFTASLLGASIATRLAAAADSRSAWIHGSLVWCIALVVGAILLSGTLAASVMGVSYAWNGGALANNAGRDTGPGAPFDSASNDAALGSLLGALAAVAGFTGALVGGSIGRQAVARDEVPARVPSASTKRSSLMPPPDVERRDESSDTVWSDPAFNRRRGAVEDRRHQRH